MAQPKAKTRTVTKSHGPKRHMFHGFDKCGRVDMGHFGVLTKYHDRESWVLACIARGVHNPNDDLWGQFIKLKTNSAKDKWFAALNA